MICSPQKKWQSVYSVLFSIFTFDIVILTFTAQGRTANDFAGLSNSLWIKHRFWHQVDTIQYVLKNDLHFNRKALRAEHGKAEMESMISQLESAKTRLEKEVLTIMILFLESLCLVKIQRKYVNLSNISSSESWNHFVWQRFRGTVMFRWPICACPVRWSRRKLERLGSRRRRCCFSWGWPQQIFLLCSFSFAMRQKMEIQVQITCDQVQISWVG